jgi:pimeloyl-ACP methyl ester carboxylesterase
MTPVVFLHASSGNSRMWLHQEPFFTKAGYRFVAYDRKGKGPAADELELVAQQLKLQRFHLVGTAAGGIVATDYALSFPQRLLSLVIANSIVGVQDEEYLALMKRLRPSPQFDALPVEVRELGPSYRAANPDGEKRWKALAGHMPTPKTRNRITFAALEAIETPTLLLTGDADLYSPPPVLELVQKRIRNARSIVVPACGHSAFWEQPETFNRAVLDFVANAGAAS